MRNIIIFGILILTIFISSCASYTGKVISEQAETTEEAICNKPYFEYMKGKCCLDKNSNDICDSDEEKEADVIEEPKIVEQELAQESLGEGEFKIKKGESVEFNGLEVKVIDFDDKGKSIIDVDGVVREIKTTNYMEIINNIKVIVKYINFKEGYLILKLETFELNEDEYLLFVGKSISLDNKRIVLRNIDEDEVAIIDIEEEILKVRILEGSTKKVSIFDITNIDSFFRDSPNERYSILKIVRSE